MWTGRAVQAIELNNHCHLNQKRSLTKGRDPFRWFISGQMYLHFKLIIYTASHLLAAAFYSHSDPVNTYSAYYTSRFRRGLLSSTHGDEAEPPFKQLKIAFVTGNQMKYKEVNMILAEHGATRGPEPDTSLVQLRVINVDLPEIQEVSTEAIAKHKALQGAQLAGGPCVVEDTSLHFTALGGMPGPFIKWFQNTLKSEGLYNLLLAYSDKSAEAICTLAFCPYPHADPVLFTGRTKGTIVAPVPGRGFGWDSIFVPDGETVPFSCMSTEKKNLLSHRGKAVRKWAEWLGKNQEALWDRQQGRPAIGHKGLDFNISYAEE